ncbi:MAG: hypothetical protein JW384_01377 [Nitrosomonadaceae bacterium]|nr:hypothetical protein [Nitrosomonadaceae bacterium]
MRNMTTGAWNSIGPAIDTANPYRRPDMLEIYRPGSSEYFIRMDTAPDSRYAGAMQPAVIHRMNINPGVETIGWCAVEGTSPLRINWLFGA